MLTKKLIVRGLAMLLCLAIFAGFLPAGILSVPVQVNAAVSEESDNLITNGDFEDSNTELVGWSIYKGSPASVLTEAGRDGSNAMLLDDRDSDRTLEVSSNTFKVVPGDSYDLSMWVKLNNEFTGSVTYIDAYLFWNYESGYPTYENFRIYAGEDWSEFTKSFVAPEGAVTAYLRLNIHKAPTLSIFADDITVTRTVNPYAYAENFERFHSDANGKPSSTLGPVGWTDSDPANYNIVCAAEQYEGSYSLTLRGSNAWAQSPQFKVEGGYAYTVDFMAKKLQNNTTWSGYMQMVFLGANGQELKIKEAKVGLYFSGWTAEKVIAVAPEGAVNAYILFGLDANSSSYGIDNLTVTKSEEPATDDVETKDPTDEELSEKVPFGLYNGDFEKGLEMWEGGGSAGGKLEVVTENAYKGQSLLITAAPTAEAGSSVYRYQSLGVAGMKALRLSCMSRNISGASTGYIGLWFYDANGQLIPDGYAFTIPIGASTKWTENVLIQAVPENAVSVTVEFGNYSTANAVYMVDEIKLEKYTGPADQIQPAVPGASSGSSSGVKLDIVDPSELNWSFEEVDENGKPVNWLSGANGIYTVEQPADAPYGKNVMQITVEKSSSSLMSSPIAAKPGKVYEVKIMAKDIGGSGVIIGIYMRNAKGTRIAGVYTQTDGSGKWKVYTVAAVAPEGAVSVEAEIWHTSKGNGTIQLDALVLQESNMVIKPAYQPTPYEYPTNEELLENLSSDYPRAHFSAEEAKQTKLRRFNTLKTKYGWTWNSQYESLLKTAEAYLKETQIRVSANTGKSVWMDVYPVLKDPNDPSYIPIYIEGSLDDDGNLIEKPYTSFGGLFPDFIDDRLKILSLAYVMTGKSVYSERAISYALQISDWEGWCDVKGLASINLQGDASQAWMMSGMVAVYDMCYDAMTEAERAKIERAIIDKGLKPLCNDLDPMSIHNGKLMMAGAVLSGCAVIMNEDNIDEIKPYLDEALLCAHNAMDNFAYSGNTEGHYYTDFGLETFMPGIIHLYNATGMQELIDHPFLTEILPYWTVMWAASNNGMHPNYSDASYRAYMKLPMALLSKVVDNDGIDAFLINARGTGDVFNNLVYLEPEPTPEAIADYVGVVDAIGYGVLRTGFAGDDMMLTLKANDSQMGHNHYDQNSIQFNAGGNWLIQDPGTGSYYYQDRSFWTHTGHSTILVDDCAQMVKGAASMQKVFDDELYGYIIGSAHQSYGGDIDSDMLTKFDRHAIQINHEDRGYYIIIDDLASSKDRVYTWQMYNGGRQQFAVDGKDIASGETAMGNQVSMPLGKNLLNLNFIGNDKLSITDRVHKAANMLAGVTVQASSAASKAHQFMTVISVESNTNADFIDFSIMLGGTRSTNPEYIKEGEISWDSSMPMGQEIVKDNLVSSTTCVFFRGNKVGDWIQFPFTIEEEGDYEVKVLVGVSDGCCQIIPYLDGVAYETVDASGLPEVIKEVSLGEQHLTAGEHTLKLEVAGPGLHEDYEPGWYLINAVGIDLMRIGVEVPEVKGLNVAEVYDTEEALGGLINYKDNKYDLVMWSRTEGAATAGKLNTDGQQASVLGLIDGVITEGFAATDATTLVYDGKVLFLAEKKLDIVASGTGWQIIADEAQTVQLTAIAPELDYVITVNGEAVDAKIENGLITMAIEAGETEIVVDVQEPEIEPSEPATKPSEAPTEPSETPTETPTEPAPVEDGGDSALWIVIAVIVVLLAGSAAGVVLFLKKRKAAN